MKLVTSLSFAGNCREAFEFYAQVLGGEITAAMTYGDGPPGMEVPAAMKDWLMHCWLQVGDQALMGSDMHSDWATKINEPKNGFDVTFHTESIEEARRVFEALKARDPAAARQAMRDHLERVIEHLLHATETEAVQRAKQETSTRRDAIAKRVAI